MTILPIRDKLNVQEEIPCRIITHQAWGLCCPHALLYLEHRAKTQNRPLSSRTQKDVCDVVTDYFLDGSTILAEKTGDNIIWYIYDTGGELLGFTYNGTPYYYLKNQQGDVYKIVDANGSVVGSYTYDPWGKVIRTVGYIAEINPIRYRSYYYDSETQLYYLQSRYYDSELGRFINGDVFVATGQGLIGNNMFAYCLNNPVNVIDEVGQLSTLAVMAIAAVVCGVINYAGQVIANHVEGKSGKEAWVEDVNWGRVTSSAVSGGISAIPGGGVVAELAGSVVGSLIENGYDAIVDGEALNIGQVGYDIAVDFAFSEVAADIKITKEVPKYIRDIKGEAIQASIKGTKNLQKFLNIKQIFTVVTNAFIDDTFSYLT